MDSEIIHDRDGCEFYCLTEGFKSFLSYLDNDPAFLDIYHTFVPPELRNRGLAQKLMEAVVGYALETGKKIITTCSYAEAFFAKHQELKVLLYNNRNNNDKER